jgi:hypothetical protein
VSLWMLIVINPEAVPCRCGGQVGGMVSVNAERCVAQRILKLGGRYAKQGRGIGDDRSTRWCWLRAW